MPRTTNKQDDEYVYEPSEMIFIDPNKDIYLYERPLGVLPVEAYKKEAIEKLIRKVMATIEPEFQEMNGFEVMRYMLVIKKYP